MYSLKVQGQKADIQAVVSQALMLACRRWRARVNERLKAVGQTDARCAALAEITGAGGGVVQRELSERLGVEEPTVVRLIDALEAQGLVERRAHDLDRRAKVVRAMPAAASVLNQAQDIVADLQNELFADADPADLEACVRVLEQMSRRLKSA